MTSPHAQHADPRGLCDAASAVALTLPPRPRWLDPTYRLHRRSALLLLVFAAGFAAGWLARR